MGRLRSPMEIEWPDSSPLDVPKGVLGVTKGAPSGHADLAISQAGAEIPAVPTLSIEGDRKRNLDSLATMLRIGGDGINACAASVRRHVPSDLGRRILLATSIAEMQYTSLNQVAASSAEDDSSARNRAPRADGGS